VNHSAGFKNRRKVPGEKELGIFSKITGNVLETKSEKQELN
jgi:hypothetical protein